MPKTPELNRRAVLKAAGVAISLPLLECMAPRTRVHATPATTPDATPDIATGDVRRMVAICSPLGIHTPHLFPAEAGRGYKATPYLEPLQPLRDKFTVISGLMHPDVDGGHSAEKSFLTGAAHPGQPSFQNTVSVDQLAAEQLGHRTRFGSLTLTANNSSLSYTRSGVRIPAESRPSRLFATLFLEGTAAEKATSLRRIEDGQSVMDLVREQTRQVARKVGREDNRTLDQYLSSVRELEQRLVQSAEWAKRPKPTVDRKQPQDVADRAELTARLSLMYDMIFMAIQTDSTRLITLMGPGGAELVKLGGVTDGWHNLSHHGRDPGKIKMLSIIEKEEFRIFGEFLARLNSVKEGGRTLLDQTAILWGSNLGNASAHNNSNLPIIAAGGHFKHGQHLAFDARNPPPLCNLLVNYLQHLGLETSEFSSGRSTLTGLV